MPFRLADQGFTNRTKVQFTTSAATPHLIYKACLATGTVSNTVYIQRAVAEALARDLGLDLQELLDDLPEPRTSNKYLFNPDDHKMDRYHSIAEHHDGGRFRIGPANTVEEVR